MTQSFTAPDRAPTSMAELNYTTPGARRPQVINSDHSRNELSLVRIEVPVADGDRLPDDTALEVEGFVCVPHKVRGPSLAESREDQQAYRRDLAPFVRDLVGADEIVMLAYATIRRQASAGAGSGAAHSPTADFVHSDVSLNGLETMRTMFGQPSREGARRIAMYNMWKLLSPGPTNRPLALCDARTLDERDVIAGDTRFPSLNDFHFEMAFFSHSNRHRWRYFPELERDRIIVFKQGDSDASRTRMVPHTAFDDRSCAADASPRASIETRCMAVWYA